MSLSRKMQFRQRSIIRAAWWAAAAVIGLGLPARGDSLWDATPYRLRVWVACPQQPEFSGDFGDRLADQLTHQSQSVAGAAWRVEASALPAHQLPDGVFGDEPSAAGRLTAGAGEGNVDKLVWMAVGRGETGYSIQAREFDCATQQWGTRVQRMAWQADAIRDAALQALADCFAPLGMIESVDRGQARVVLRAARLAGEDSPVLLEPGSLLQPVIRRNDRLGRPQPGGIRVVPWTVLEVNDRREGLLDCTVHTGIHRALREYGSYRTKQLALAVRPGPQPVTLSLQSRIEPHDPLVGYGVLLGSGADAPPQPLGETDFQGRIVIPAGEAPLLMVYLQSGSRLLARLPLVAGRGPEVTVQVAGDAPRLAAEAFLAGVEDRLTDIAVRRALLAAQIRAKIAGNQVADAAGLFDAFRLLPGQAVLGDELQRQRSVITTDDPTVNREIDQLFRSTRERIGEYLDADLEKALAAELERARSDTAAEADARASVRNPRNENETE